MKIQHDNLQGSATSQTQRSTEISSPNKSNAHRTSGSGQSTQDHLEISSFAEQVQQAGEAHSVNRAQRVKELTALYQSGRYHVDAAKVSKALVDNSVSLNPSGKS